MALPAWLGGSAHAAGTGAQLADLSSVIEAPVATMSDTLHLLNRITYGPRPGEPAQVERLGYDAFLEQQLYPGRIDDTAMNRRLAAFPSLTMRNGELLATYKDGTDKDPWQAQTELMKAAMLRAAYSKRQLFEVMVDFWGNHLNVSNEKDGTRWFRTTYDRDVLRRYALGKFRNLLMASAKSAAMLEYLDNRHSRIPNEWGDGGVNENFGRELLELHTVGSDAGYTEADVRAVARAFTGWTLDTPWSDIPEEKANPGEFRFLPSWHDNAQKRIPFLNLTLPAGGGIRDGETIIARLASHPKTAQRIAHKLCVQFVSDNPSAALVSRIAQTYLSNNTDVRAALGALLRSPEFKAAKGQRVKLPVRALISYVRALGVGITKPDVLLWGAWDLNHAPFAWPAPNGYPQAGAAWLDTSGMLARWNWAHWFADGWEGVTVDLSKLVPAGPLTAAKMVDSVYPKLLHGSAPAATRTALMEYVGGDGQPLEAWLADAQLVHLVTVILGSPAFQTH